MFRFAARARVCVCWPRRVYLQTVVQGKVLVAFTCGEEQVTRPFGFCSFVSRHLSVFHRRRLQIVPNADKLPPGLCQLGEEPQRQKQHHADHYYQIRCETYKTF